jgi:EAL domain-containing protein (putative c-di-GMP-specific phosphodiesterase class I)
MAGSAASAFPAGSPVPALIQPAPEAVDPCAHLSEVPDLADLEVHYQPMVSLPCGQPVAVEAHLRWRHPRIGVVPPCVFAGEAEKAGTLAQMTELAVERALTDLARARWLLDLPQLRMWISLSGTDLANRRIVDQLVGQIAEQDYAAGSVIVSIPERDALEIDRVGPVVRRLRSHGVWIGVDQLASRHAAHVLVDRLPIDVVKLSRLYIAEAADSMIARAMIRSIVRLGRRHDVAVVAGGVEQPEVAAALTELGVRTAQGAFFGRPNPIDRLSRLQWDEPAIDAGASDQENPAAGATSSR